MLHVLTQLCQHTCEYSTEARRIMVYATIYTRIFYCSIVFVHRLYLKIVQVKLQMKIQRPCDLIRTRAYRTASTDGLIVVTNSSPLDLLVVRRCIRYKSKLNRVPRYWGPFEPIQSINEPRSTQWRSEILDEWGKLLATQSPNYSSKSRLLINASANWS